MPFDDVDKAALKFLLEQNFAEMRALREAMIPVRENTARIVEAITVAYAAIAKSRKLARRVRELEKVTYENAPIPELEGPPGNRRPTIRPPSPSVSSEFGEDSGITELPPQVQEMFKAFEEAREQEKRRDSWVWRKSRSTALAIVGAVLVFLLGSCGAVVAPRVERALFGQPK